MSRFLCAPARLVRAAASRSLSFARAPGAKPGSLELVPETVRKLLRRDYRAMDGATPQLFDLLLDRGAGECWHKHGSFFDHLRNTWAILHIWGQDMALTRAGLFHSAFSNSYVNLRIFEPDTQGRLQMSVAIGPQAEALVWFLCEIDRHHAVVERLANPLRSAEDPLEVRVPPEGIQLRGARGGPAVLASPLDLARLLIFTLADIAEQHHSWQDDLTEGTYFLEQSKTKHLPWAPWPGASKPGLWMSFASRVAVATHCCLSSTVDEEGVPRPPVFDHCTSLLSEEDERAARDLYWEVAAESSPKDLAAPARRAAAVEALRRCAALNPHVGEPHALRAQLLLSAAGEAAEGGEDAFREAEQAAEEALRLLCAWGTPWDKRVPFEGWVAWTRVLHQMARERTPWPGDAWGVINFGIVDSVANP